MPISLIVRGILHDKTTGFVQTEKVAPNRGVYLINLLMRNDSKECYITKNTLM